MNLLGTPIFEILRTKMGWIQARQGVLAENVANANTPDFVARDLKQLSFDELLSPPSHVVASRTTHEGHIALKPSSAQTRYKIERVPDTEASPTGNAVVLEDQMLKISANQADFQAASTLYAKGVGMLRIALGGGK